MVGTNRIASAEWLEEQLGEATRHIGELTHALTVLRNEASAHRSETDRLHQLLATLDGRTQRHEGGQELVRALQQEVAALGEQLAEEAALRRDQLATVEREREREHDREREAELVLRAAAERVAQLEAGLGAEQERHRHLSADVAEHGQGQGLLATVVEQAARRLEALQEIVHRAEDERALLSARLPETDATVDELVSRTDALQREQQRLGEELATVRAVRDRERELLELLEQQRSTRARLEARLADLEEELAVTVAALGAADEQRTVLRQQTAGTEARIHELGAVIERDRDVLIAHVRRLTETGEQAGRRQAEEIDRQTRAGRELLTRLAEALGENAQEQPL